MMEILLGLILVFAVGAFALLAYYVFRRDPERALPVQRVLPVRGPQHDVTNMMILLQTMRDIVRQQKELAHQFNESLEKRVGQVKQATGVAMENLGKLRDAERKTATQLEEAKAELASLQRQIAYLKNPMLGSVTPEGVQSTIASRSELPPTSSNVSAEVGSTLTEKPPVQKPAPAASPAPAELGRDVEPMFEGLGEPTDDTGSLDVRDLNDGTESPTLQILASPREASDVDEPLDNWVGFDFGGDEPDPYSFGMPTEPPEAPEDPEAARDAFRALLSLDAEPTVVPRDALSPPVAPMPSGNGQVLLTPIQSRVYEYNDAGMSVPQIAQELGIGKGEVRLILSLRKGR